MLFRSGVGVDGALELGMKEKSVEFSAAGGEVYLPPPTLAPQAPDPAASRS